MIPLQYLVLPNRAAGAVRIRLSLAVQKPRPRCMISAMLGNRTDEQWISQYSSSHQHPVNRACHTLGIPTIILSVILFLITIFLHRLWPYGLALFVIGWILQFIGHVFEGKAPEFFRDWRFLLVGTRWWWAKIHGKA